LKHAAYPSALLLTLILAACGGGGSNDSASTSTASTAASDPVGASTTTASAADASATTTVAAGASIADYSSAGANDVMMPTVTVVAPTAHLYVATTGSDTNPGTQAAPLKSILRASQLAKPGTMVHVAAGNYPGSFQTATSGTATARISYVSDNRGAARIIPPANSTLTTAWYNTGNYVDIVGFDIDGTSYLTGKKWATGIHTMGSNSVVKYNYVHHISTTAADCTAAAANGGAGIVSDNYYGAVNINVLSNVVHDIGVAGCISIHGIYPVATGNIQNNIVYNIGNVGIHSWHAATGINITNNTVVNADLGILVGGDRPDNFKVSNNIVVNTRQGILEESSTSTYGYNIFTNNLVYQSREANFNLSNKHTNDVIADPQFSNAAAGDYRLKSTSPAISKGLTTYAPADDLVGTPRPTGTGIDLGGIEFRG
jgi:hypothetical protein